MGSCANPPTSRGLISLVLLLCSLASAGTACANQQPSARTSVTYGSPFEPNSLNPITAPDLLSRAAIEMIFDGLVATGENSQIQGELADKWEFSPDGRDWTFHLRKGVKWHDGYEFTADDVKFTYDTVTDPNAKPTVAKTDYASVRQIDVLDPYTVRFRLARPNAALLSCLTLGIAPKHLLEGQDLATTTFNQHPIGTGPFTFEKWSKGASLSLRRNPDYFGTRPRIDSLIWKVVPDSTLLALQAARGEVDLSPIFNPKDSGPVRQSGQMALHDTLDGNTQISLQLKNPLFQDVRVRQALAYGIDTQAVIDGVLDGAAVPATSDILPTSWAYNPNVRRYQHDQEKARALLAEAGWTPGPDGVLTRNGQRFALTLMTDAGHKTREQVMLAVRQYWSDLGLDVRAITQERNSFVLQRVLKGDFDAVLLQSSVQIDPDLSRRFHSASIQTGHNFISYSNPTVDRLLEQGVATMDQQQRREAYFEVQQIMAEELPQIPLFYPKTQYASKVGLEGVNPIPSSLFWNAEQWDWR